MGLVTVKYISADNPKYSHNHQPVPTTDPDT